MASRTRSTWDDRLMERKIFSRLAHAIPGAIVYCGMGDSSPSEAIAP
jgi:hypothetical protein